MDDTKKIAALVLQRLKRYEFGTFKVIAEPKTAEAIAVAIINLLDARQDRQGPDIVIEASQKGAINITSNPLRLEGRYKILSSDITPSKSQCRACRGSGCSKCNYTGATAGESAEEIISKELIKAAVGQGCEFGQKRLEGGEYEFSIRVTEPKKRKLDLGLLTAAINKDGKIRVESLNFA